MKIIILLTAVLSSVNGAFPDDPKPCKYGDYKCIAKVFEYYVHEKHDGSDDISLSSVDPMPIKKLHVSRGADSPVNINFLLTNGAVEGFKRLKVLKAKGFGKEIATNHEIVMQAGNLSLEGTCDITGKVLILPISGNGKCNISMTMPKFTIGWTGVPYEKDGATYMKIDKPFIDLEPKAMTYYFANLFNDKALSENMNKFLTENWKDIYPEIRTPLVHGISLIIRKIISNVFNKLPYESFFADSS